MISFILLAVTRAIEFATAVALEDNDAHHDDKEEAADAACG